MRSKIPKIISGILAIILIVWFGYALLPPVRFWIGFEFAAAVLVAVGCVGELYLFHIPSGRLKREKDKHHHLESRFILAVAVGVTMELFALTHALPEAIRLENTVALTESNNLVLRSNVAALELQVQSVGNVAEMNSPKNFPIKSISGYGVIGISGNEPALLSKALGCPISLELINNETGSAWKPVPGKRTESIDFEGRVYSVDGNVLKFTVNGERRKTPGLWQNVTFNNVGSVRADFICTNPEPPFVISGGFLDLTLDSLHDVQFHFSAQTNEVGGEWGVVGVRVRNRWDP
jgi:hypothetical protein